MAEVVVGLRRRIQAGLRQRATRLRERMAALALGFSRRVPPARMSVLMPVVNTADPEMDRLCLEAVEWVRAAIDCPMAEVSARVARGPRWPERWPGEHYRLLAASPSQNRG
jgi:hypothetical protein